VWLLANDRAIAGFTVRRSFITRSSLFESRNTSS
jgi:hypothetical protein